MKNIAALIVGISACFLLAGAAPQPWKVTLKLQDEAGQPIAGAETWVGYMATNKITGLTDSNGVFTASHTDGSFALVFFASKPGYYPYREKYDMGFPSQYSQAKWNPSRNIILRQIGNRIPMYAKKQELKVPKEATPLGFDLIIGDWVAPYGKGDISDLLFTVHRTIQNDREFDAHLTVTFPNKGDGIVVAPPGRANSSASGMLRIAADTGYNEKLDLYYSNTARPEPVPGYFIRVRTALDANGQVKGALYGKIAGNFRFYAGTKAPQAGMGFNYYLNPTPNDLNLEFNPKMNLLKNLKSDEAVTEP